MATKTKLSDYKLLETVTLSKQKNNHHHELYSKLFVSFSPSITSLFIFANTVSFVLVESK